MKLELHFTVSVLFGGLYRPHFLRCLVVALVTAVIVAEIVSSLVFVKHIPLHDIFTQNMKNSVSILRNIATGHQEEEQPFAECSNRKLGGHESFALVGLCGYPRSGLIWSQSLIEYSTGFYGSTVKKRSKRLSESKLTFADRIKYSEKRAICVRSSRYDPDHINKFEAAILLLRSPFEAIVSEAIKRKEINKTLDKIELKEYFQSNRWRSYILREGLRWRNLYLQWLMISKSVIVIHFNSFINDTFSDLKRMVRFLNVPVDEARIKCALAKRQKFDEDDLDLTEILHLQPFSQELYSMLVEYINDVNVTLFARGHGVFPSDFANMYEWSIGELANVTTKTTAREIQFE